MIYSKKRSMMKYLDCVPFGSEKQQAKLVNSVYHTFRTEIISDISTKVFHKHFCIDNGRPTKDLQSVIGLFLLQALKDMTDEEAIEAYCFNDAFRYALDISREEYISERAYYYYRAKLLGEGHAVFNNILTTVASKLNLDHSIQRTDSTLVRTWLKSMSKLELFSTCIKKFLRELQKKHPIVYGRMDRDIRDRYLPEEDSRSWFAANKPSEYQECLITAAGHVLSLMEQFKDHKSISRLESFALLQRLAHEQIQVQEDGQIVVKVKKELKGTALVNPHDPDARYDGHRKSVGFTAELTETCGPDKDTPNPRIITRVDVRKANIPDCHTLKDIVHDLEIRQLKPQTHLADNGYDSDENYLALQQKRISMLVPPSGKNPEGLRVMDFSLDSEGRQLTSCPTGQPCEKNRVHHIKQYTTSWFNPENCQKCPHKEDCPVKHSKRKSRLTWKWSRPRIETRRMLISEDDETRSLYRQRAGGEAAFSIAKRKLGLKRLRRRGLANTTLSVILAATALNILRMHLWLAGGPLGTQLSKNKAFLSGIYKIFRQYLAFFMGCTFSRCNQPENRSAEA